MEISAQLVKQLRERTGAGMMECKKALVETKGDVSEAEVVLRKHGIASAAKKSTRTTMQGAAADPQFVRREDVTAAAIAKEKDIARARAIADGKPERILDKIVEGRLA